MQYDWCIELFDENTQKRWAQHCANFIINNVFAVLKRDNITIVEFEKRVSSENLRELMFMCFGGATYSVEKCQKLADEVNEAKYG